jgi:type IV secretion system protein TrbF
MPLFRTKKQIALSPAPGGYAEEDPEKIIFDNGTRLRVEANHWKAFCFILAAIAAGAVYTRQPPPSVVKSYGVSSDPNGHAVVTQLTAYKPDDQATRVTLKETVERWFTIEPVLTDSLQTSRMARNINAVKAQMIGTGRNQFGDWLKQDAPFQVITANPKLVREVKVDSVSLLPDSTAVVEFSTTSTQNPTDKPAVQRYALTIRYQIVAPTAEDALSTNGFGFFFPFFTLQKTA